MSDHERLEQLEQRAGRLEARQAEQEAKMELIQVRLAEVEARHEQLMNLLGMRTFGDTVPGNLHELLATLAKSRLN